MNPHRLSIQLLLITSLVGGAFFTPSALAGNVVYVDDDAPKGGDGSSWNSAFAFLHDAILLASDSESGVSEIRVSQGIYLPDRSAATPAGSRDREATFRLVSGVAITGGYAGLSAGRGDRDQRDITKYHTILCGDLNGDDGPDFTGTAENSYQVVTALNVDRSAVIDGFTITAGRADGPGFGAVPESREQGSGLNIYFSSPTIRNCTFTRNWSLNHGAINDHGDMTMVVNCSFIGNYAEALGAGLYIHHHSMTTAIGCVFEDNQTPGDGAGAYSRSMHCASLTGCTFAGNSASRGAGMYSAAESMTMIADCSFSDGSSFSGAGMYNDECSPMIMGCVFNGNDSALGAGIFNHNSTTVISECRFFDNQASFGGDPVGGGGGGGSGGAGVWNEGGSPSITDCSFSGNSASFGAGIYSGASSLPSITNCEFTGNLANEGAAVYNLFSNAVITDCSFTNNSTTGGTFIVGGAVSNYFCSPVFTRCEFTGNSADHGGGAMFCEARTPVITNCVFRGNTAQDGGAIFNFRCSSIFSNCLFIANSATGSPLSQGGAIYNNFISHASITNCTFVANSAPLGAVVNNFRSRPRIMNCILWDSSTAPVAQDDESVTFLDHCLIEGGWSGLGRHNIDADPLFIRSPGSGADRRWGTDDDEPGDLRLLSGSPCIDAGYNRALMAQPISIDFGGAPRYVDDPATADTGVGSPRTPIVDLGAFEFQPPRRPSR